ncbi:hypothetical protein BDZ97DRAFT_1781409 [Flammula alnicola]|nr:hypothetical protein BDZ97DRAFT_1781409 [Flammula alnicola]
MEGRSSSHVPDLAFDPEEIIHFEDTIPIELTDFRPTIVSSPTTPPQWHPRLTPYRLMILLTTICIGTAKAVATQRGSMDVPITLDWVSGVVVFLVFFLTGPYESRKDIPRYLAWMFELDCMDAIWWLLDAALSIPRPRYMTEERPTEAIETDSTIFTTYRLLTSATVTLFGMTKAGLSYWGLSTGANWVDWLLGVVATSILYILGLYENNSLGKWASFFMTDRSQMVYAGRKIGAYTLFVGLVWAGLSGVIKTSEILYPSPDGEPYEWTDIPQIPVLLKRVTPYIVNIGAHISIVFGVLVTAAGTVTILRSAFGDYNGNGGPFLQRIYHGIVVPSGLFLRAVSNKLINLVYGARYIAALLACILIPALLYTFFAIMLYYLRFYLGPTPVFAALAYFMVGSIILAFTALMALILWIDTLPWAIAGLAKSIRDFILRILDLHYGFSEFCDSLQDNLV